MKKQFKKKNKKIESKMRTKAVPQKKKINRHKYLSKKINVSEIIEKRYKILIVLIALLMIILLIKIFYMQVVESKKYTKNLVELTENIIDGDSTPRGRIYDRNGKVIVDNKAVKTIYYKRQKGVSTTQEIESAYKVARYISVNYEKLTETMLREFWVRSNPKKANEKIKESEWQKVKERKITSDDIYKLKLKRVTEKEINSFDDEGKETAYIYYLMNKGYSYAEKTIKNEDVTDEEYATIAEHIDEIPGFNTKLDWERDYPYESVFKTMLGKVSTSETGVPEDFAEHYKSLGHDLSDRVGTSYIEYQYNEYLTGKKGKYKVLSDGSYKEIESGTRGNDVVLTIDIELQKEVEAILEEELLAAKKEPYTQNFNKSFVVITNPNTGEVLAMAGKQIKSDDGINYKVVDYTPGVITSSVTPGSIVKGASHIVGYNNGALNIGERRNDACIKIAATPIKCSYHTYGVIDDIQALKYSSNTYQFQTAIKVGKGKYVYDQPLSIDKTAFETYRKTFAEFGLGVKTNIDLPNESLGYKGNNTLSGYLLDFSIGQYDTYTPIQLAQYIGTIATSGKRIQPYLLKNVYSSDSNEELKKSLYEAKTNILNTVNTKNEYFDRVREGFRQVLAPGGTGHGYINDKYNAAGKTGTSESFVDTDGDGKIDTETITATFGGYAPYNDPKVAFAVISPDVATDNLDYNAMSKVNRRITTKVSEKYFEFYK